MGLVPGRGRHKPRADFSDSDPRMKPCWSGVSPACKTQLDTERSLDLSATARALGALIVCGSPGVNRTLERQEKRAAVRGAVEAPRRVVLNMVREGIRPRVASPPR